VVSTGDKDGVPIMTFRFLVFTSYFVWFCEKPEFLLDEPSLDLGQCLS
jgi:hypothetical protein